MYDAAGVRPRQEIHGASLLPALRGGTSGNRPYLTSRHGNTCWYRDERWWVFGSADGSAPHAFDLEADAEMRRDLGASASEAVKSARDRIRADAGGEVPVYTGKATDAIGQKPVR